MQLIRLPLPETNEGVLAVKFPMSEADCHNAASEQDKRDNPFFPDLQSARQWPEVLAFLSFASWGDMKFSDPGCRGNREAFLARLGIEMERSRGLDLVHSRRILFPKPDDPLDQLASEVGGADGLMVSGSSLVPTVTVADCMPIWLWDRDSGCFGTLHSGWKGTGILAQAVAEIGRRFGSKPASMAAILGPAIGSCCYRVDEGRAAIFEAEFGPRSVQRKEGQSFLDLREANIELAQHLGLGALLSLESCTSCDQRLGSFRRQGPQSFTRMLAGCAKLG